MSQRIEHDRSDWACADFSGFFSPLNWAWSLYTCLSFAVNAILPPLPHSISVMMDHQVIRTVRIWNYVSSLMDQFLSVWPSTERSMCFYPCFSPKNPRCLSVMAGRGKKGMHRVLMLWAAPAAFPLSTGGFWVGIWQWGLVRKARVFESLLKPLLLCTCYKFPKLYEPQFSQLLKWG